MNFSLSKWVATIKADAQATVPKVLSFLGNAVPAIDSLVKVATPVLAVVDPAVVPAVQAADALLDEAYACIKGMTSVPTSGNVTLTISATTAQLILKIGADAESWLASVGVAVSPKVVAATHIAQAAVGESAN